MGTTELVECCKRITTTTTAVVVLLLPWCCGGGPARLLYNTGHGDPSRVVTTRPSSLHNGAVMKFIILPTLATLLLLLDPVRSQFVFFGNQFGGQQQPQPRPAAASRPVAPPTQPTVQPHPRIN